jgi:hypothetical protein
MPVVACYDMHLYCDVPGCEHGEYGVRKEAEYTGDERGSQARRRARRAGWWLGRNGACACPKCAKAGHRPVDPID